MELAPLGRRSAMDRPLRVAIVAASLRILGGQAVQAQRLLDAWQGDQSVKAWLVPINPVPPRPFARCPASQIPPDHRHPALLLAAALPRVAARPTWSTSFRPRTSSFLLAPLPAVLIAQLLGKAGRSQLPQRRSAGPPAAVGTRPARDAGLGSISTSCRRHFSRDVLQGLRDRAPSGA